MEVPDLNGSIDFATKLQFRAAELLIKMKDESFSTQKIFALVLEAVDDLYQILMDIIQGKFMSFGDQSVFSVEEICLILKEMEGNSLFEGVKTADELSNFVGKKRALVNPVPIDASKKIILAEDQVKQVVTEQGFFVPFLPMLETLLNCPEVLHCIDNPRPTVDGVFSSPLDGYVYKHHPLVKKYPGTLGIRSYDDDASLTDTASSQDVSIRFAYWTLLNIYEELRSANGAIHLLSCVKTDLIKSRGHKMFWSDFVQAMKQLSSEEGVTLTIMGKKRVFHGVLVGHNADNPAAANMGGFKESHFANRSCRQCLVTSLHMYDSFDENNFVRRSKESHEMLVTEVETYIASKAKTKPSPSVQYGINHRSILMEIPMCDVTKVLPQDLMHDVILGNLKLEIILLFQHTLEKKKISLRAINGKIDSLSKFYGCNKPAAVEESHLVNKKLRQSATETLALAYLLPFALQKRNNQSVDIVCDEENLNCYILRLNLLSHQMSDQFTLEDIEVLKRMTIEHHQRFQVLYPGNEVPKLHFETLIRLKFC